MARNATRALSEVLDHLDHLQHSTEGDSLSIGTLVDALGTHAFASLMLVFALLSTSPASSIPGITTVVAIVEFIIAIQMITGRHFLWLPSFITRRRFNKRRFGTAIAWLRKPIHCIECFLKPRLPAFIKPPGIYLPLLLILIVTPFMPLMELIPLSGTIASAGIALFAAALLTRDGLLVAFAIVLLVPLPLAFYYLAFS